MADPVAIAGREAYARLVNAGYAVVEEAWAMKTRRLVFLLENLLAEYHASVPGTLALDDAVTIEGKVKIEVRGIEPHLIDDGIC